MCNKTPKEKDAWTDGVCCAELPRHTLHSCLSLAQDKEKDGSTADARCSTALTDHLPMFLLFHGPRTRAPCTMKREKRATSKRLLRYVAAVPYYVAPCWSAGITASLPYSSSSSALFVVPPSLLCGPSFSFLSLATSLLTCVYVGAGVQIQARQCTLPSSSFSASLCLLTSWFRQRPLRSLSALLPPPDSKTPLPTYTGLATHSIYPAVLLPFIVMHYRPGARDTCTLNKRNTSELSSETEDADNGDAQDRRRMARQTTE